MPPLKRIGTDLFQYIEMFYAIIIIVTAVAIFLIIRNDHDDSYNKSEKGQRKAQQTRSFSHTQGQKESGAKAEKKASGPSFKEQILDNIDYDENLEENTETFDITGLRYHCTVHDCGKIVGIVKPEPSNIHDPRAQAVYRNDGKLLGYIPRTQLNWYEDFNEQNIPCPFVGEIELDRSSASLIAEIKVIIPSNREFVEEEIEDGL